MTDATEVLLRIFIVLVVAKAAAELAERARIPVVVAEIAAGALIGPSALHLVAGDQVLRLLGEIGIVLLLLEVGLQMEIADLVRVGPASLLVATIGVIAPFAGGFGAGVLFGESTRAAVFLGAALTATSVGITARVFSELRVLTRVEARTVLGAAVADDVLGLVILTVVLGVSTGGALSILGIGRVLAVALAFLVVASWLGLRLAPKLFALVHEKSLSPGTYTAASLAFALGLAVLAGAAGLAPIVGAFVAGLSLAGTPQADRVRAGLAPVGHLFIPVFFLQIGIDARVQELVRPAVLGLGAALLVVAIAGKLVSSFGSLGRGDRLLIGLGMMPRGEVGLIFAGLGLRHGLLGQNLYSALLLVILATTLIAPPLLRRRLVRVPAVKAEATPSHGPDADWLAVDGGVVDLAADPPAHVDVLQLALRAALLVKNGRPGPRLLDWLASLDRRTLKFDEASRALFFEVLRDGGPRAWRFLEVSAVLDRALPELASAVRLRTSDRSELDPMGTMRWLLVESILDPPGGDVAARGELARLDHPERLLLAALVLEAAPASSNVKVARSLTQRLGLGAAAEQDVALLVRDSGLMRAAAARRDGTEEESILRIAAHLERPDRVRALYVLSLASGPMDPLVRARLDQIWRLVQASIEGDSLARRPARNLVARRRAEASRRPGLTEGAAVRAGRAPRPYAVSVSSADIARHAALADPRPAKSEVRVAVATLAPGSWRVEIAARDRVGLLARTTGVLLRDRLDVREAIITTWEDGAAVQSFEVAGDCGPDATRIKAAVQAALSEPIEHVPVSDAVVMFDNDLSPWHTHCEIRARDRVGLLHALATSIAGFGAGIHSAKVVTEAGEVTDVFELTDASGEKLSEAALDDLRREIRGEGARSGGVVARLKPRRLRIVRLSDPGIERSAGADA